MTLSELLLIRAALRTSYSTCKVKALEIIKREVDLKELERTLNTKEGNDRLEMK